jgi:hypothetical protein
MGSIINYSYYNVIAWKKNGLNKQYPKNILSSDFEGKECDYLLFLKLETKYSIPDIDDLIASLELIYTVNPKTFVVLTPRKNPPPYTATEEEFVFSFSCQVRYFKKLFRSLNKNEILSTDLLFELLDLITKDNSGLEKLLIRQFPFKKDNEVSPSDYDVIIPHRGDNDYLSSVLSFLNLIKGIKIYAGIDQDITEDILKLIRNFTKVSFYNFTPNPVGPYVVRNRLIDQSCNELIFFQDSDDIPCADRFTRISSYMKSNNCQLCGSHELRMDYYNRTVQAVRFPIDVIAALKSAPWHSLLHPSSAITRKAFYKCGTLSEERTFGNDTKFLLYSFFILNNIMNIDEFLYIRKRHPGSLTTSPETMISSPERRRLLHTWNYDFEQVKMGNLNLENSSLPFEGSKLTFEMIKM